MISDRYGVVVIGSGAAGLSAALAAAISGAQVAVLESTPTLGGTSALSGGLMFAPRTDLATEAGYADDRETVLAYLRAVTGSSGDDTLKIAFVDEAPETIAFLTTEGVALRVTALQDYVREAPGAGVGRVLASMPFDPAGLGPQADLVRRSPTKDVPARAEWTNGMALVGYLLAACRHRGVEVHTGARVRSLVQDGSGGRVRGVEVEVGGHGRQSISADGVVIASAGFEFDDGLKQQYLPDPIEGSWSCPGNVGDSIRLAVEAGAELTGLGSAQWYPLLRLSDRQSEGAPVFDDSSPARNLPGSLVVDTTGQRFANEGELFQDFGHQLAHDGGRRLPAWLVVDQRFVDNYGARSFGSRGPGTDSWRSAPSLADLGALIHVDSAGLEATVRRFNEAASDGKDPDFGRGSTAFDQEWGDAERDGPSACLAPLEQPPFHATRIYAGSSGTTGGPRVDHQCRVLGQDGQPIPGLFAAGNAVSGPFGGVAIASGSTLGPALVFGEIAGRGAAAGS
jgi:succinate dehydrogenase/fumarate reductase flavoprotein subunit